MITPRDEDYQQTKRLKKTGAPLKSPFKELADWIGTNYGVRVLNVVYDTVIPDNRPRLSVILERQEDALKFRKGALGNFNRIDQKRVQERFESILLERRDLKAKLANKDFWEISRCFDSVTFFFYTDAQVKQYETAGLREACAREYSHLVQPYDEFGYFERRGVAVYFDSKENFDTNYQSNWHYYYK